MERTKFLGMPVLFLMPLAAAIMLCLLQTTPAHADGLTVSLSPLTDVAAGSTGDSFDVLLTNGSGSSVSIEAFFFEVLSSSSDITFTDATTASGTPYIFGADSLFGPDIIGPGSTPTDLNASDLDLLGSIALDPGTSVALGHVLFDVSPTALTQDVSFNLAGFPGTSLADDSGNDVPIQTFVSGKLGIEGTIAPVPEPSTLILLLAAAPLAFFRRVLRRQSHAINFPL
jgi:hypothetical protein